MAGTKDLFANIIGVAIGTFLFLLWISYSKDYKLHNESLIGGLRKVKGLSDFVQQRKSSKFNKEKFNSESLHNRTIFNSLFHRLNVFPTSVYVNDREQNNLVKVGVDYREQKYVSNQLHIQSSNYSGKIFMDWVGDSESFSYVNYKSLESLLIMYPFASITVHLIAPNGADYYKIGNLISKHYFQKYKKYGYDIKIRVLYMKIKDRGDNRLVPPGANYWNDEFIKCCDFSRAEDIRKKRAVPLHLYFYRRILSLYANGGIYSDFSWYHVKPLLIKYSIDKADDSIDDDRNNYERMLLIASSCSEKSNEKCDYNGAYLKISCLSTTSRNNIVNSVGSGYINNNENDRKHSSQTNGNYDASNESGCHVSTIMAFHKHSKVLYCMLLQYNTTTTTFMQCIEKAEISPDVMKYTGICIKQALDSCFQHQNVNNDFFMPLTNNVSSIDNYDTKYTELLWLKQERKQQLNFMFPTIVVTENSDSAIPSLPHLSDCVLWLGRASYHNNWSIPQFGSLLSEYFSHHVFQLHNPFNKLARLSMSSSHIHNSTAFVYNIDSFAVTKLDARSTEYQQQTTTNSISFSNSEYNNNNNNNQIYHPIFELSLHSNNKTTVKNSNIINHNKGSFVSCMDKVTITSSSSQIALGPISPLEHQQLMAHHQQCIMRKYAELVPTCHKYSVNNDDDGNIDQSSSNAALTRQQQGQLSCTLHFVIPGFMKAGTTFLFNSLMTHPQIVNALLGVAFKETGCYLPEFMRSSLKSSSSSSKEAAVKSRMQCFPFIEPGERMYFGDGTVWYAQRPQVTDYLLADNPDIKVIFSIRNPVHRTESHHRFNYKMFETKFTADINEILDYLFGHHPFNRKSTDGEVTKGVMSLYYAASAAANANNKAIKAQRIEAFVQLFFTQGIGQVNAKYKYFAAILMHSIYFPAIYSWLKRIPPGNVLIVPSELLSPTKLSAQLKYEYIRNLSTIEEYDKFCHAMIRDNNDNDDDSNNRLNESLLYDRCNIINPTNVYYTTNTSNIGSAITSVGGCSMNSSNTTHVKTVYKSNIRLLRRHTDDSNNNNNRRLTNQLTNISKLNSDQKKRSSNKRKTRKQRSNTDESSHISAAARLDNTYLMLQFNRLYRFLDIPELMNMPINTVDAHATGTKTILPQHTLNSTMRAKLHEFYKPFNALLEGLLGGSSSGFRLGYDDNNTT